MLRLRKPKCRILFLLASLPFALFGCDTLSSNESLYSEAEIAYFREIAFGSEYGISREEGKIAKWTQDPRILLIGDPSEESREEVRRVIEDLNTLVGETIEILLCQSNPPPGGHQCISGKRLPNIRLRFIPREYYPDCTPNYADHTAGYFSVFRTKEGEIYGARICIGIQDSSSERVRNRTRHLIREELTQVLGLMQDSHMYPESIFYQDYSAVTSYAEIDRALIEMLYRPEIRPGMTRAQATSVLRGLER